jgi:hypothetical protein
MRPRQPKAPCQLSAGPWSTTSSSCRALHATPPASSGSAHTRRVERSISARQLVTRVARCPVASHNTHARTPTTAGIVAAPAPRIAQRCNAVTAVCQPQARR